ncbi:hypothetical protein EON65_29220 [archaeon]|nr:MAG: hypothetical protein EON65_29220 [archaeon]
MSPFFSVICVGLLMGSVIAFRGVPSQPKLTWTQRMTSNRPDEIFHSSPHQLVNAHKKNVIVEFIAKTGASNPINLMVAVYFIFFGIKKVNQFGAFVYNLITGKKTDATSEQDIQAETKTSGLHTFECNKCGTQVFPARDRVYAMLHNPRFRCASCGAKAASFFDINDMDDPRAVARIERLRQEKEEEYGEDDEDDADEDEE